MHNYNYCCIIYIKSVSITVRNKCLYLLDVIFLEYLNFDCCTYEDNIMSNFRDYFIFKYFYSF